MDGIPLVCGTLSDIFGARLLFLGYALLLLIVMVVVWMVGVDKKPLVLLCKEMQHSKKLYKAPMVSYFYKRT